MPPIKISPSSGCSKPAINRKDVVLPQPDGPRSDRNSPLRTFKVTALTAVSEPNRLVTARSSTSYAWSLCRACTPDLTPQAVLGHHMAKGCLRSTPREEQLNCRIPAASAPREGP